MKTKAGAKWETTRQSGWHRGIVGDTIMGNEVGDKVRDKVEDKVGDRVRDERVA